MKYWAVGLITVALAACSQGNEGYEKRTESENGTFGQTGLMPPPPGVASQATLDANRWLAERLPLDDQSDRADAERGRIAFIDAPAITDAEGNVVWSIPQFDFLDAPAPDTVNPSLWRQSQLAAHHGLFEVSEGIWQVRGYDLAVMSIIEGDTGWIIVDPLTTTEAATAALKLVNDTLGARPVTGMLYTHSHADHFGGARGIIDDAEIAARNVPVIAPIGFSESAVSENLIAGNLMSRRSVLMFGNTLPRSETGHVGSGLGPALTSGTISLILPTEEIAETGAVRVIDGVTFEFIDAGGTEAPAEFMFYLPERRALCTAEVATGTLHNLLTPRGAKVRDALRWSRVIDEVLAKYGGRSDVVFASHHWPTWGSDNVIEFLTDQRDVYRYIHDQTMRRANAGATMFEAAEMVSEPDVQSHDFSTRGYYGTLNHNSKAVYQHYFGWWSGVPAEYFALPPVESAPLYVDAMGGETAAIRVGIAAYEAGNYRWAAEVFNHVVFAYPQNQTARDWLAASYEQIGYQAESGAWRSYFLTGAQELRRGVPDAGNPNIGNPDFLKAVPTIDLFDAMAVRYSPALMQRDDPFTLEFTFPDTGETISLVINSSVIVPRTLAAPDADARVTVTRSVLDSIILGQGNIPSLMVTGDLAINGDARAVTDFFQSLEQPDFWFGVATP